MTTAAGGRRGYLDEETAARIVQACKAGAYLHEAAAFAGIGERTLYEWMQRGREYDEHLENGGEIIEGEDAYRILTFEVEKGRAEARISAVGTMRKAWQDGEWRAALAYLERTDPQNWGRVQRVALTGGDGGPVRVADVTEQESRLAKSLRERLQAVGVAGELGEGTEEDVVEVDAVEDIDDEKIEHPAFMMPDDEDDWYPPTWPTSGFDFDL